MRHSVPGLRCWRLVALVEPRATQPVKIVRYSYKRIIVVEKHIGCDRGSASGVRDTCPVQGLVNNRSGPPKKGVTIVRLNRLAISIVARELDETRPIHLHEL